MRMTFSSPAQRFRPTTAVGVVYLCIVVLWWCVRAEFWGVLGTGRGGGNEDSWLRPVWGFGTVSGTYSDCLYRVWRDTGKCEIDSCIGCSNILSSYRAVNTHRLCYTNQSDNAI